MATVAACVPTRNRAPYLRATLDSILSQTRLPDLLVISDDGSADDTPDVMREYAARCHAVGIELRAFRHEPPIGQEANRRFCFEQGTADFVAMVDDDDLWRPEFLTATALALIHNPQCSFASTAQELIDANGHVMKEATERHLVGTGRFLLRQGPVTRWTAMAAIEAPFFLQSTLFRRAALEAIGFVPVGSRGACDNATFLGLAVRGALAYFLPQPLAAYREHARGRASDHAVELAGERRDCCLTALAAATHEDDKIALRLGAIHWHKDVIMELAHTGRRREALTEARALVQRWGLGAVGVRIAVYFPAVLLGVDRLRSVRRPPRRTAEAWRWRIREGLTGTHAEDSK